MLFKICSCDWLGRRNLTIFDCKPSRFCRLNLCWLHFCTRVTVRVWWNKLQSCRTVGVKLCRIEIIWLSHVKCFIRNSVICWTTWGCLNWNSVLNFGYFQRRIGRNHEKEQQTIPAAQPASDLWWIEMRWRNASHTSSHPNCQVCHLDSTGIMMLMLFPISVNCLAWMVV